MKTRIKLLKKMGKNFTLQVKRKRYFKRKATRKIRTTADDRR